MTRRHPRPDAGSSSIKFSLFEAMSAERQGGICDGEFDGIGHRVHFVAKDHSRRLWWMSIYRKSPRIRMHSPRWLEWVERPISGPRLIAAGHRVVHGGSRYTIPVRIDSSVIDSYAARSVGAASSAHNLRHRHYRKTSPGIAQIACL